MPFRPITTFWGAQTEQLPVLMAHLGTTCVQPALAWGNKLFPGRCSGGLDTSWLPVFFLMDLLQILFASVASVWPGFLISCIKSNTLFSAPSYVVPHFRCSGASSKGWAVFCQQCFPETGLFIFIFFLKAFSFPVAQQLLTHPGSCWQLLLLSTLAILAAAFELRVVGTNAEP